jgi:hypothetical protein
MNSNSDIKIVALFTSPTFDLSWPEDEKADPNDPPLGLDCATYIVQKLKRIGLTIEADEPFQDEATWCFFVTADGDIYTVIVMWAQIGDKELEDTWVIQLTKSRSGCLMKMIFADLFIGQLKPATLVPMIDILDSVLRDDPNISELRWLTEEQFHKVY